MAGGVLVLVAATTSTWILSSPVLTWREVAGAIGCSALAVLLTGQVVGRYGERQVIKGRQEKAAEAEAERWRGRMRNTGTWHGGAIGQVLTVRYEPEGGQFYVEGWLGDHFQVRPERVWSDRATLVHTLAEMEVTGELEPQDDEGTRAVRARLDLPGPWNEEEPVVTQPQPQDARTEVLEAIRDDLGVDDTRRLTRPPVVQGYGPSAAALRPIAVPVFRTEAERAQWAHEHDIPTEVLPVQRYEGGAQPGWPRS
jgi:hypothetical protein